MCLGTPETKSRSFDPSNSLKPMESLTFAEKLAMKKKQRQGLFEESTVEEPWYAFHINGRPDCHFVTNLFALVEYVVFLLLYVFMQ